MGPLLMNCFACSFFRSQLLQQYEKFAVSTIASDEEDAKQLAKRKMLGNIKFIGELGKLQIIQDSILHRYLPFLSLASFYLPSSLYLGANEKD